MTSIEKRPTVFRLGTVLGHVAILVAVTALNLLHVERLWALSRHMSNGIAVAAFRLARLRALARHVALLTTVVAAASSTTTLGAVLRKVAS